MDKVKKTIMYDCGETVRGRYTGRRSVIAVLDTGAANHPDLKGRVAAFQDFVEGRQQMYDDNGHGTHICGILCGSGALSLGKYAGMAPGSRLLVGKVLDKAGDGAVLPMLQGLDWVLQNKERYGVRILNISVGIGSLKQWEKEEALRRKIEQLWDSGIVVVCAAGNKGPGNNTISSVGGSSKVITVGCHDGSFHREHPRRCETYSGRGEWGAVMRKPDVVAPGTEILSCNAAFHTGRQCAASPYIAKCGTSMATPIVAGAAALLLQKYPQLTNEEVKRRITYTATDLGEPWNLQGWGMINVKKMLDG